jgi:hypothetical protein
MFKRGLISLPRARLLTPHVRLFSESKGASDFLTQADGTLVVDELAGLEKRAIVSSLKSKHDIIFMNKTDFMDSGNDRFYSDIQIY